MPREDACPVRVQTQDFDPAALQRELLGGADNAGAVATFTGYVRAAGEHGAIECLELEHYPGMTERSIAAIIDEAATRWPISGALVVHRVGPLRPGAHIVWVGVAAAHRGAAFSACEFIMDYLKTRAPFWKKEHGEAGAGWVCARTSDTDRARRWAADGTGE